jgi:hypothetical protein
MGTARFAFASAGIQTAALASGGATPSNTNATEEYDGSSWTAGGNLNTTRAQLAGCGLQTAALAFGGAPVTGATEQYNGSSWTTLSATLNLARERLAGAGTITAGLAFGGEGPPNTAATEEFSAAAPTTVTLSGS